MKFFELPLQGAFRIELTPFSDERGKFARTFCKKEFAQIGFEKEIVQINHSYNPYKGTLRGMHFQHPPHAECKIVRCVRGRVYDVIVDIRAGSPTFLQHFGIELAHEDGQMLFIPEGFAHGFQALEDGSELLYLHSGFYEKGSEDGLRHDDKALGIAWALPPVHLSARDNSYSLIDSQFKGLNI
jgi:dTDP-4-dehydrorhamnose 3,5-epimerase